MSSEEPTLGYLIEQLELYEQAIQRADRATPAHRATMKFEELQGHMQQAINAGFMWQQARENYDQLRSFPGFDRLQVYCEAEWGEEVTLKNARRIRGTVCKAGYSLEQATSMHLNEVARILSSTASSSEQANIERIFPDGVPNDSQIVGLAVRLDSARGTGKTQIDVAREFTEEMKGSEPEAKRLLARIRMLKCRGKLNL